LATITFDNPRGKDGRYLDLMAHLYEAYWYSQHERLRYIGAITPSTRNAKLFALHLLWQGELPDFRWISGWLIQNAGRTRTDLRKHVYWEGNPQFSTRVARDVLDSREAQPGQFDRFEHQHGWVSVRISEQVQSGDERVSPVEYFAQHAMTDETVEFESAFSRGLRRDSQH